MECERCKGEFPITRLSVDTKGKRLVCDNCITYLKTGMLVTEKAEAAKDFSEIRKKLTLSTEERLDKMGQKKDKYECASCDYTFSSIRNYKGICPYCGEDSVGQQEERNIIKEIDEAF